MARQAIGIGPVARVHLSKILANSPSQAGRVAVLDQNITGRFGEKTLQFFLAAPQRQVEAIRGDDHPRAWAIELQVFREHHPVIIAERRFVAAQFDGQDRNPPPCQPAGDTVDDHPKGEIGKGTARLFTRFTDNDLGKTLLAHQGRLQVFEH
ncbi:hypothetical protein D3C84_759740 [compost metagenome]